MENISLSLASPYTGCCVILTTKHAKSLGVAPPFWDRLGASMLEYVLDTDLLRTFTGKVERDRNAIDCARRKCELSMNIAGVDYGLASEGNFRPHPLNPLIPCDFEALHFIDRKRGFNLSVGHCSEKTNYRIKALKSLEELEIFARQAGFPSHGLILQPSSRSERPLLFKGINTWDGLETAFHSSLTHSPNGKVWVQTDMRAHMNPTRMAVIGEVADKLAQRLATACPACGTPGWGSVRAERGLPCELCGKLTRMVVSDIFGCVLCEQTDRIPRSDGLAAAPQQYCKLCNP
jgi:hypothetical protein